MQIIQFYAEFARLTGSIPAAVFLTYAVRYHRHYGGWFSKTFDEWKKATTLSRNQQIIARQKLRALGVLQEVRKGIGYKLWYWVDMERLNQMLNGALKVENPTSRRRKIQHPDVEKTTSRRRKIQHPDAEKPNIQTLKKQHPDVEKFDVSGTAKVGTYVNVPSTLYVIENKVVKGNTVDNVVESSSSFQDSFLKEDCCLQNNTRRTKFGVCGEQGHKRQSEEDDGKEREQTDLVISAGSSTDDKESDASAASTPATHSLTVDFTIAENKGAPGNGDFSSESGGGGQKHVAPQEIESGAENEGAEPLSSENAQKSLIGDFLSWDIPEVVAEQENAPERLETALERKSAAAGKAENGTAAKFALSEVRMEVPETAEGRSAEGRSEKSGGRSRKAESTKKMKKTETPEEREFREGFYDFAKKAVDWIVSKGGVREDPSHFWAWAKRLKQRDERITPDILKQCFQHYASNTNGSWWRSNTKTLKQFVAAFEDIYQSYQQSCSHVQTNQSTQSNQPNRKGDNHALYSANHEFHKRAKYWQEWLQTAYQSGLSKTRET